MEKSQLTRKHIIEKAGPIFNKKGYAGTTFSDIIEGTGYSKGAIYGHFRNKDDLAVAVLDNNLQIASKIIFSNVEEKQGSAEKLIGFARSYSVYYDIISSAGGCPVINAGVDSDDGHKDILKRVTRFLRMWQNSIDKIIKEGIEKDEFQSSPELEGFSSIFISLIEGGILLSKITNNRKYIDDASEYLVSLVDKIRK